MSHRRRPLIAAAAMAGLIATTMAAPVAAEPPDKLPSVERLKIDPDADQSRGIRVGPNGRLDVVVQLEGPSVTEAAGETAAQQKTRKKAIDAEQQKVKQSVNKLGGRHLGSVSRVLNALIVRIGPDQLTQLAATPGVLAVRPLRNYELDLPDTVPYIGARSGPFAQPGGAKGTGIRVAVLDSGVDYTHANLGGPGTAAAYEAAYGTAPGDPAQTTRDGLFPTAKVIDGWDFVGEDWPNTPEAPDEDPIDFEGHGTHVADIIAGTGGVATGASILAVKVCSAVSTSCSGLALLQAMDFALDPNGDGDLSDRAHVINMSLGSPYGQEEDDLALASQNAVKAGVTVVVSAGNSADRPYIAGSPSTTPGVISVAQSQVPSAVAFPLVMTGIAGDPVISNTATVEWAPVGTGFTGQVARIGRGCPAGSVDGANPDDPLFNGNDPAGKVALIDRGGCSVSLKVDRATKAGAVGVLIANNVSGDPPSFSFGGGDLPMAPTIIISLADGNRIKTGLGATGVNPAVTATVSPAVSVPLVGSVVASSSRGPSMSFDSIKPDIAAPGASVSAIAGSGTGTEAFGGTSGAAPMVSGAAALLLSINPRQDPLTIKARLMGTAETNISTNPATQPGVLAPITRIGGGEVRVDAAAAATVIAYNTEGVDQPSLSFGFHTISRKTELTEKLTIRNLTNTSRSYTLKPTFRYASDEATGAVVASIDGSRTKTVTIAGGKTKTVAVRLKIDPAKLPAWPFTFAPSQLGNGALLNGPEFDGYIEISGGGKAHVPWHVLPRAAAKVDAAKDSIDLSRNPAVKLRNRGAIDGDYSVFALTGTSGKIPRRLLPRPGENLAAIDLRAVGIRAFPADDVAQVAVTTWDERSHPAYPAGFEIQLDTNLDGTADWFVFNQELTGFAATGQVAVFIQQAGSTTASAFFFLDADLNSPNRVFTFPMSAVGLAPNVTFEYTVLAYDNYFSGEVTDELGPMRFTAGKPRYVLDGELGDGVVPAGADVTGTASAVYAGDTESPSQRGFLVMNYNGDKGAEAVIVKVKP